MLRIPTCTAAKGSFKSISNGQFVRWVSGEPPIMSQVRQTLKDAMRSGDNTAKNSIRAVMAAVKNANIDKPGSVSSDIGFHGLVEKLISTRNKSIDEYIKGNRQDLADVEKSEIEVLKQLQSKIQVATEEEIDTKVKELISSLGLPEGEKPSMKRIMGKFVWPEVERDWRASQKSVVSSVKKIIGTRGFSTSSRVNVGHDNPLGLPRRHKGPIQRKRRIQGVKKVIVVSSAKGGVGKSTVAVNLALALYEKGHSAGILDVDIFGPSLPTMLNLQSEPRLTDNGHLVPLVNYGVKAMSMGFLIPPDKAVAWRGLLVQKALEQLLFEVEWGELDYLVIDMPPGTSDIQLTMAQQLVIDGAIIVSTPQDIALIDAKRGINMFQTVKTPILGMVQNMSVFVCPGCHTETHIFGHDGALKEAQKYGLEVLGNIPLSADIALAADAGKPAVVAKDSASAQAYLSLAENVTSSFANRK